MPGARIYRALIGHSTLGARKYLFYKDLGLEAGGIECDRQSGLTAWKRRERGFRRAFEKPYLTTLDPLRPEKTPFGEYCVSTRYE